MNSFQRDTFNYLSQDGHLERKKALVELIDGGFFATMISDFWRSRSMLDEALSLWEKNGTFCEDGINRMRLHFSLPIPAPKPRKIHARVVLDLELETTNPGIATTSGADYELVAYLQKAASEIEYTHADKKSVTKVTSAAWVDYTMQPEGRHGEREQIVRK